MHISFLLRIIAVSLVSGLLGYAVQSKQSNWEILSLIAGLAMLALFFTVIFQLIKGIDRRGILYLAVFIGYTIGERIASRRFALLAITLTLYGVLALLSFAVHRYIHQNADKPHVLAFTNSKLIQFLTKEI